MCGIQRHILQVVIELKLIENINHHHHHHHHKELHRTVELMKNRTEDRHTDIPTTREEDFRNSCFLFLVVFLVAFPQASKNVVEQYIKLYRVGW